MKNLTKFLVLLLLALPLFAQEHGDITGTTSLTSTCSNANTSCDTAGVTNFNINTPFSVQGPQTLEVTTQGYGLAAITAQGTYTGSTLNFEISPDGGTTWFPDTCTRSDTNLQELSEAIANNAFRAWDCSVGAATKFRVRQSALSTGAPTVTITLTTGQVEPAPTVQMSINGVSGSNACVNPHVTLVSTSATTSGTTSTQIIALSGTTKIYVCSLSVVGQSGTTPTFALQYGTGSNCAAGTTTLIPAFATPANTMLAFANPLAVTPSGQALCYIQTGTTPVSVFALSYVQQ